MLKTKIMKKFLNPFSFMPLRKALCWGIAALILTSIYCWQIGLRLTSLTQVNYLGDRLWATTLRQIVVWLLFSGVLYVIGVIASRSRIRFWDVASYNLFARIPFNLSMLVFAVPMVRSIMALVMEGSLETVMQYQGVLLLVGLLAMIFMVWYFVWSYFAFSVATNLKGVKGVTLFMLGWFVTYLASGFALLMF